MPMTKAQQDKMLEFRKILMELSVDAVVTNVAEALDARADLQEHQAKRHMQLANALHWKFVK